MKRNLSSIFSRNKSKSGKQQPDGTTSEIKVERPTQRYGEWKYKLTFSERLVRFSLKYTSWLSKYLYMRMPNLGEDILKSNLSISPDGLIAVSMLFTLISIPFVALGTYLLAGAGYFYEALFLPIVIIVPLLLGLNLPKISASNRGSALDAELPYLIGYITVLAGGGVSPFVTIKRISHADSIFPAAAREARRILLDIEVFGLDAISALEKAALYNPNKKFGDFIGGYISVLKAGGDVESYLESKLKDVFAYREIKIKSSSEFIGTLAEAYIIATVVTGVSFFILFLTQNLLQHSASAMDSTGVIIFSGLFVPLISVVMIVVTNAEQIREPFSYNKPYYVFLASIPLGVLFYFLPLGLPVYIQVGIALALTTIPPAFVSMQHARQRRAVEGRLANFLRDLSEVRKTGLAPEKTIEQLAGRNYSGLSKHVQKISTQLSWGIPIRTVLENFSSSVKSWVTKAMTFLLLEVVDVGGGSSKMFVSLADFTERNDQLDKERKSQVRPYVLLPYIGAILVVVTTGMMVYLLSAPGLEVSNTGTGFGFIAGPQVIAQATSLLLTASFFQAWLMGFVAGKMGEGSVAAGFKHSTLLVVISIIAVIITRSIVAF